MSLSVRPSPVEYPPFHQGYVGKAEGPDLLEALRIAERCSHHVPKTVSEVKARFRHAQAKWSTEEVVQHLIDRERVFAYRALRFARKDIPPLPGFEENDHAPAAEADHLTLDALMRVLDLVRSSNMLMIQGIPSGTWVRSGNSNGRPVPVRAICRVIAGHSNHHTAVLAER